MAQKNSRKVGRNSAWCKNYRNSETRGKNKAWKLLAHITRYGATDHCAVRAYNALHMLARAQKGLPREIKEEATKCKRIKPQVPMTVVPTPAMPEKARAL